MAIEEPKFSVETKASDYEVRKYGVTLVAETKIEGDFESAGNKAFRILADYIFGNNTTQTKIEMTTPVAQQSEKIAMTAPVTLAKDTAGYLVQFTMPEKYNMQTIPKPMDGRVVLRESPARKVAVYTYSGSWSEERYNEKLKSFLASLETNSVKTIGNPIFARFNSPFQLWFLRRNEIWIEVAN
jgi:hypothetical protein